MHDPLKAKAKVVFYSATAFLAGLGLASGFGWTESSLAMPAIDESPQVSEAAVRPARDLSDAFVNLSEAVTPGVVRIEASYPISGSTLAPGIQQFFGPQPDQRQPRGSQVGGGSGFVVSNDGYIMTNDHVVNGATEVRVYFPDKRVLAAEIVGSDPFTDVAVIKVDSDRPLTPVALGNSDEAEVGQWVLAIGNPGFGAGNALDFTITAGIVSARGRSLDLIRSELSRDQTTASNQSYAIEDYIQTDAVINPGNSGGPMVDITGRVIGINSAIASRTGYYQGYGFAIPINLARRVMEDLVEYGYVRRPILGVSIDNVTVEDAEYYGLPSVSGVKVQTITPDGPAERAGLQMEDVIVSVDGVQAGYVGGLQATVAMKHPGEEVTVGYYRNGDYRETAVRLGEAPLQDDAPEVAKSEADVVERIGMEVRPLDSGLAAQYGFERESGVLVTNITPGSVAQRSNLFQGDVIIEINRTEIGSVADMDRALSEVPANTVVRFLLERNDGSQRVVNLRMPG